MDKIKMNPKPLMMQAGLMAAVGLGIRTLSSLRKHHVHPLVVGEVAAYPGLAMALTQLAALGDDERTESLVEEVNSILLLDGSKALSAQWLISRKSASVMKQARQLCGSVNSCESDTRYRDVLMCSDEVLPQLESHLDNILHNHLLSRG